MICPDCGTDNIDGVDVCETCGQPLIGVEPAGDAMEKSITRHTISVLVPKTPVTVPGATLVRDAVAQMVQRKIGCLFVMDNDQLVGVFTERDVLNKVVLDLANLDHPVTDFMTPSPETITHRDSIAYAMHAMDIGGYRHMPVVDDEEQPVGVISVRDILKFLCIRFANLRKTTSA